MVPLTRYHLPAVVLVGVGVAVAGQAYSMVQWEDTYRYTVGQIGASEIPPDASTPFQDLSPAARELFLTVHDRGDGYTTTKRASDLRYDDDDVAMDGYNYVRYGGEYYRFYAGSETGQGLGALVVLAGGLPVALALVSDDRAA